MKPIRDCFFAALLVLVFTFFARADVIVNNTTNETYNYFGPIGDDADSEDFLIGQEFTLPAGTNVYQLDEISLLLGVQDGGGSITVSLWTVSTNNNPGNEIATLTPQEIDSYEEAVFVPSTNIILAPGNYYVVAAPTAPDDSGLVGWADAENTNSAGTGSLGNYADTESGVWTNTSVSFPQQMSVVATPVISAVIGVSQQTNSIKLSWPAALSGYVVESTTNLAPANWQPLTNAQALFGSTNVLTNSLSGAMRFFRLRQSFAVSNLDNPTGTTNWDGPIGTDNNRNDFLLAEEFTLPSGRYSLSNVVLDLNPANGQAHITASLWNAGPENTPSDEVGMVATQLVTTAGPVSFVPYTNITLSAGSYYVVASTATSSDNGKVGWFWTSSALWTGFGSIDGYAGMPHGYWEVASVADGPYLMSIQATPIQ